MTKITTILLTFSIAAIMFSTATVSMMPAYAQDITITKTATPEDIQVLGLGGLEDTNVEISVTGFGGTTTEPVPLEIVLVIDESGSLSSAEFAQVRQFAINVANSFTFGPDATSMGLVMFSSNARTIIPLTDSQTTFLNAINSVIQRGGSTCIPCGVRDANTIFSGPTSVPGATQVMIVLSDGANTVNTSDLNPSTVAAEADGTTILAVGVGIGNNPTALNQMQNIVATQIPGTQTFFQVNDFANLQSIVDSLVQISIINTSPSLVNLIETTQNYIVNHASFSTIPDSQIDLGDGRIQLTWNNIGQYVGNNNDRLAADETFTVSFTVNSNLVGNMLPVNDLTSSEITYLAPDDSSGSDQLPQAYINVNGAPDAMDDSFDVDEDSNDNILDVIGNLDGMDVDPNNDALTIISTTDPTNGSVNTDGSVVLYTPDADYSGPDSFDYTVSDGSIGGQDTATVTITVIPVNDPPVAENDLATTDEDTPVDVVVLTNDTDPEDDVLTVTQVTQGSNGAVSTDGTIVTYTPDADFNGSDSFTYTITDGEFESTATVNVTINPINDAPVCSDATVNVDSLWPPNHKFTTVTPNMDATDVDGDNLIFNVLTVFQDEPVDGTGDGDTAPDATINGDGTVDVRAERSGNENGRVYQISVQVSDGELSCIGTVQVGVPHDKKDTPVDDGAIFDSTTS